MSRCGCSNSCNCILTSSGCGLVTGNGSPGTPYNVDVKVDPDADNQVSCQPGGLFVPPPTVVVADTDCVNMDGTGAEGDPITASPILDEDVCNVLSCGPDGFLGRIFTEDSDCASMTGCGTEGDPLIPAVRISSDPGNVMTCHGDGLYMGAAGAGAIDIHGSLGLSMAYSTPVGVGSVAITPFPFDVVQTDFGSVTDVANSRFEIPIGGAGWYRVQAKYVENGLGGDSFESGGAFYQIEFGIAVPGKRRLISKSVPLMVNLDQLYDVSGVIYLDVGDHVIPFLNIIESTGLLAVAARPFDVSSYADGTFPCAFEIQRIGV